MIAGTLAQLQRPADDRLEDTFDGRGLPALDVRRTQDSLDGRPVQQGVAASRIEVEQRTASVTVDRDGDPGGVLIEREPVLTDIATEWVADVTDTGLIAAESVGGPDRYAFPFDIFASITDRTPDRLAIDVQAMHEEWVMAEEDGLTDAWMTGAEDDDDATSIQYHDAADVATRPTFGLGFVKPWHNTVNRGVVYASGYVAVYNANSAESFVRFVEDAILPFTERVDETVQETLGTSES